MEPQNKKSYVPHLLPSTVVFVVLGGVLVYAFMVINSLTKNVSILQSELASTSLLLASNTSKLAENVNDLNNKTAGLSNTINDTKQNIEDVKSQVGGVQQSVGVIGGAVGNLQKLVAVDPEILKKYSKVYFTNENYTPAHLTDVPNEYVYSNTRSERYLSEAWPHLKQMLDDAKSQGNEIFIKSAYRSFAEQKSLKSTYSVIYGAGTANTFSADQGYSEHQLGTAIDVITSGLGGKLEGFEKTQAFTWMQANAYRYGFVISYPKGNKFYVYEPWHWRFVGVALATHLHNNNQNFYDLDQREIDKYLANVFD